MGGARLKCGRERRDRPGRPGFTLIELLVGNFGSGTIMAFDARGRFRGLLEGARGGPVTIDGLWALTFGNGTKAGSADTVFFTAGPDGESHGLFGALDPVMGKGRRHDD
jgi:uncharacterized protein (TIGR03118 family)